MSADCDRFAELAPELALGIADGQQRAEALDHLAGCAACRAHLERLSALADELLLLAPPVEAPAGFEARVATALDSPRPVRRSLARRLAIPALAAVASAAVAAVAVWLALDSDRELADSYRDTLAVANGEYFDAAPMEAPGGRKVGYVYGYEGRTSWVLGIVYDGVANGSYRLEAVTEDGRRVGLRELQVADGHGSAGSATPIPYEQLAEVRLLDGRGREVAETDLRD